MAPPALGVWRSGSQAVALQDPVHGASQIAERVVYLVLTECSGEVRVLNGGHMPPVVVRAGDLDRLPPGSMALGIMADATFTEQRVELSEGDALIVFSDGVSEAMNSSGDFFGDELPYHGV